MPSCFPQWWLHHGLWKDLFFPRAICYVSKRDILFSFPCPSNNIVIVTFKRWLYIFIPCQLQHWEGPSFLSSPYSVCDDKFWALMAVFFIHFFTFSIYLSGWTGQAFISLPNPVVPVDHLHHVLTLLILTLKMPSSCFLKYSGSHLQDYKVPSPSRPQSEECQFFHSFSF